MKKNIFLIVLTIIGFSFSANAQSCCKSKAKNGVACSKKSATTEVKEATISTDMKVVLASSTENILAKDQTEKFTVYGNCGMCERTIEGALKDVEGVVAADWDGDTDEMTVTFNPELITLDNIKQKIADVGYDSDTHRASDKVYSNLHGCCQYERPAK
ncbi:MAG: heavy-metal-associated domain-containing protein [Chitinophagales bacterium]